MSFKRLPSADPGPVVGCRGVREEVSPCFGKDLMVSPSAAITTTSSSVGSTSVVSQQPQQPCCGMFGGFNTLAVHEGQTPDKQTGAVIPPIYMTSTYQQDYPTQHKGYDYTRAGNPTFDRLESQLAVLEGGRHCAVFSSGLGAASCLLMATAKPGDQIFAFASCYGGTFRLLRQVLEPIGVKVHFLDFTRWEEQFEAGLRESCRQTVLQRCTGASVVPRKEHCLTQTDALATRDRPVASLTTYSSSSPAVAVAALQHTPADPVVGGGISGTSGCSRKTSGNITNRLTSVNASAELAGEGGIPASNDGSDASTTASASSCGKRRKKVLFFVESPTNPLLEVVDIRRAAQMCSNAAGGVCEEEGHEEGHVVMLVVDNTFATPFHQRPLELGADAVLHSCTKYIGGHSDVIGGAVVTNNAELATQLKWYRMSMGFNPSPFDCWLLSRSLKTLGLRMERHSHNALTFAERMQKLPYVRRVIYPGLSSHPQHELALSQSLRNGFSGVVSVEFNLTKDQTMDLISAFHVFTLAESLGGVESLADHPASMTHASIPPKEREAVGINDGLVRFSVGIEDVEDIVKDVESAFYRVVTRGPHSKTLASDSKGLVSDCKLLPARDI